MAEQRPQAKRKAARGATVTLRVASKRPPAKTQQPAPQNGVPVVKGQKSACFYLYVYAGAKVSMHDLKAGGAMLEPPPGHPQLELWDGHSGTGRTE